MPTVGTKTKNSAGRKRSEIRLRLIGLFLDDPSISGPAAAHKAGSSVTLAYELKRAVEDVKSELERRVASKPVPFDI